MQNRDQWGGGEQGLVRADHTADGARPRASQAALVVKDPPANAGGVRDGGFYPWVGKIPGGERGNSLQDSCLENPMDRGAWRAAVLGS